MSSSYVKWKGLVLTSMVPKNARPPTNNDSTNLADYSSPFGKARPLKHWRKQLSTKLSTNSSKTNLQRINKPGGLLTRNTNSCLTFDDENMAHIKTEIRKVNNSNCTYGTDSYGRCLKKNITRSASTKVSPTYYTSTSGYLHSRGLTHQQKSKVTRENSDTSSKNSYNTGNYNHLCSTDSKTIYKPSNSGFSTQGAVSAGDRLTRLKYNTITKNASSFTTAYGSQGANAGRYHGSSSGPYFVKNKVDTCYRRTYNQSC
tara:strand:+ start:115 stop:888 length:774 start_codon:yes stop_codon:yes gene_type:complete